MPADYVPNNHRTVKASQSIWLQSGRVYGVAPGTEQTATEPTVKCTYADGTSAVRTVRDIRTKGRARTTKITAAPRDTSYGLVNNIGQDYS